MLLATTDLLPDGGPLNGRRSAGQTLLWLWSKYSNNAPLAIMSDEQLRIKLNDFSKKAGHRGELNLLDFIDPSAISEYGALFLPDPSIGRWANWRASIGSATFSLIGQTHTISTPASLALLQDLITEPTRPWDALICSSNAGKSVVESVLEDRIEKISKKFNTKISRNIDRPYIPVIPLPIATKHIRQELTSKNSARQELGVDPDSHVVLWLGRLSMLTKFDPWPTYLVLQKAALKLKKPLVFIECGPDDTSHQANHFHELRTLCPDVRFLRVGGEQPVSERMKFQCLSASDIAVSLVDNTQETFGLSVAEAMAAGLPVVASDWDGYKDLIRDGIDGFLIPTKWSDCAKDLSFKIGWSNTLGIMDFPVAAGCLAQLVQIDLSSAVAAIVSLLSNPVMNRGMGEAARIRAENEFSDDNVMSKYIDLFELLNDKRKSAPELFFSPEETAITYHPVNAFASYPSISPVKNNYSNICLSTDIPEVVKDARNELWSKLKYGVPPQLLSRMDDEFFLKHHLED